MGCKYCDFGMFQHLSFTDSTILCNDCAGEFHSDEFEGSHLGKNDKSEHVIKLDEPIFCPHCGFKISFMFAPCGGMYSLVFNTEEVEIPKLK